MALQLEAQPGVLMRPPIEGPFESSGRLARQLDSESLKLQTVTVTGPAGRDRDGPGPRPGRGSAAAARARPADRPGVGCYPTRPNRCSQIPATVKVIGRSAPPRAQ